MSTTTTTARKPRATKPAPSTAELLRLETLRTERDAGNRAFDLYVVQPLCTMGYPAPKPEWVPFPGRKWRVDFAYIQARLAIEIDGGITGRRNPKTGAWEHGARGGHVSVSGYTRDRQKDNELACIGWRVLRFTTAQVASGEALDWTERALRAAGLRSAR